MKVILLLCVQISMICLVVTGTPADYVNFENDLEPSSQSLSSSSSSSSPSDPPRSKRTILLLTSLLNAFTNSLPRPNPPRPNPPKPNPPAVAPMPNNNAPFPNAFGYNFYAGVQPVSGLFNFNPLPPAPAAGVAPAPAAPPTQPMAGPAPAPPAPPAPQAGPTKVIISLATMPPPPAPATNPPPPPPPTTSAPPPPPPPTTPVPQALAGGDTTTGGLQTTTDLQAGGQTTLGGDGAGQTTTGAEGEDDEFESSAEVEDDDDVGFIQNLNRPISSGLQSSSSSESDDLNNNNYWNQNPPTWFRSGSFYSDPRQEDVNSGYRDQTITNQYTKPIGDRYNIYRRDNKESDSNEQQRRSSYQPAQSPSYNAYTKPKYSFPQFEGDQHPMPASHSRVQMHDDGFDHFTYHDNSWGAQPTYRVEFHGKRQWN